MSLLTLCHLVCTCTIMYMSKGRVETSHKPLMTDGSWKFSTTFNFDSLITNLRPVTTWAQREITARRERTDTRLKKQQNKYTVSKITASKRRQDNNLLQTYFAPQLVDCLQSEQKNHCWEWLWSRFLGVQCGLSFERPLMLNTTAAFCQI